MRAPEFWNSDASPNLLATLLTPAAFLYGFASRTRQALRTPHRAKKPVVCIGNATVGGAGKTPVAIALARQLRLAGETPAFLSRGYGGAEPGPLRVDPLQHTAREVGDEPLLLANHAPTWIARDRAAGADLASAEASVILMDDGFQNESLCKDFCLLVVDAQTGFGNGRVFPAGPLREPAVRAFERAEAVMWVKAASEDPAPPALLSLAGDTRAFSAWRDPVAPKPDRVYAFTGIARPEKFFETLERAGYDLAGARPYPDHHPFSQVELEDLTRSAADLNALLITTEKDHIRLPAPYADAVRTLKIDIVIEDELDLIRLITNAIEAAPCPA